MKKLMVSCLLILGFSLASWAQDYSHAIGGRLSGGNLLGGGITYKNANGFELVFNTYGNDGWNVMGLWENMYSIGGGPLYWYWGLGLDAGMKSDNDFTIGADGTIGLEITVIKHLNLAIDYIPRLEIIDDFGNFGSQGNLSIRFAW